MASHPQNHRLVQYMVMGIVELIDFPVADDNGPSDNGPSGDHSAPTRAWSYPRPV
jgi:hypothetical protein